MHIIRKFSSPHRERIAKALTTHGHSGGNEKPRTGEYSSWANMKQRCLNPDNPRYYQYGGRGIRICKRWQNSFSNFLQDLGPKPHPKYTIERIDNDGNYEPSNCKWDTKENQNKNSRKCRFITFNGQRLTVSGWSIKVGISRLTISARINKLGWDVAKALSTPHCPRGGNRKCSRWVR